MNEETLITERCNICREKYQTTEQYQGHCICRICAEEYQVGGTVWDN